MGSRPSYTGCLRLLLLTWAAALTACGPGVAVADPAPTPPPFTSGSPTAPPPTAHSAVPTRLPTAVPSEPTAVPASATAPPPSVPPPSSTPLPVIELLFTGDINPGRCVYTKAKAAGDMTLPYQPLAELLQNADITIGSLDGTLTDHNPPNPCVETHRNLMGPAEMVAGLSYAGFDVITVATNHAKDCGLVRGCVHEAMFDTMDNLRAAGIQPVGTGANLDAAIAPVVITVDGVRFGFVAMTAVNNGIWATSSEPGAAPFKLEIILESIRRARAVSDVVVVLPHWGREFSNALTYEQVVTAERMVAAGATLVVGNHPHRVQGVESFPNGALTAYALGNFVFDMTWSDGTLFTIQGMMLRARFQGRELIGHELLPIRIHDDFQPRLAGPDEATAILQEVELSMASAPPR